VTVAAILNHGVICLMDFGFCSFVFFCGVLGTGARLPLYALKRVDKVGEKELPLLGCKEHCPVAFLDSLILGEVFMNSDCFICIRRCVFMSVFLSFFQFWCFSLYV